MTVQGLNKVLWKGEKQKWLKISKFVKEQNERFNFYEKSFLFVVWKFDSSWIHANYIILKDVNTRSRVKQMPFSLMLL